MNLKKIKFKKTILSLLYLVILLSTVHAIPPIAQEFYGIAVLSGSAAPLMATVQAYYHNPVDGNETLCGTFQISEAGKYGLLPCMGDDPQTPEIEGAQENEEITFKIVTFNATYSTTNVSNETNYTEIDNATNRTLVFTPVTLNATAIGNNKWNTAEFHLVNLYAEFSMWWLNSSQNETNMTNTTQEDEGFCGDGVCSSTESCFECSTDCGACPPTPPATGGTNVGASTKSTSAGASRRASTGGAGPICTENWKCTEFNECLPEGIKTRNCEDISKCGTTKNKPKLNESCCYEDWTCHEWSECSPLGEQTRACIDQNNCTTDQKKPNETQVCKYPTCNDGIQNQDETGIDCGGPCLPCKGITYSKPIVEAPTSVAKCGDNICNINELCGCPQDCRKFPWFIIAIGIGIAFVEHIYAKRKWKKIRENIYLKRSARLKQIASLKRKSFWFKIIVLISATILAFYFYYFATCPGGFRRYLAVLIGAAVLTPVVTYFILKRFEYSHEEKELRYESLLETHKEQLERFVEIENQEMRKIEIEISKIVRKLKPSVIGENLKIKLDSIAYRLEILSQFLKENKDYIDVESKLCEEITQIKEDEEYKKAIEKDEFKSIDSKLNLLLTHHQEKQETLKRIVQDEETIAKIDSEIESRDTSLKAQIKENPQEKSKENSRVSSQPNLENSTPTSSKENLKKEELVSQTK